MDPKYNLTTFIGEDKDVLLQRGDAQNKTTVKAGLGDAKLILCYFSMHVCPPCREFTPILEELYREFNETSIELQVIFFSGDKD